VSLRSAIPTPSRRPGSASGRAGAATLEARRARLSGLVEKLRAQLASTEPGQVLKPLAELRGELSISADPPIQEVIDVGGLVPLVASLGNASPAVQGEAAWALTNIAAGDTSHATAVLDAGAVPSLLAVLRSPALAGRGDLCDHILSVLLNLVADDDCRIRDHLLAADVVGVIGALLLRIPSFSWSKFECTEVLRKLTGLMSGLCRGSPPPALDNVDCAFDYFVQVVMSTEDVQMLCDALWGMCHLLEGATEVPAMNERAAQLLSSGFDPGEVPQPPSPHPFLAQIMRHLSRSGGLSGPTTLPALRLLGALMNAGDAHIMDAAIAAGALKALFGTLAHTSAQVQVRQSALRALAIVATGNDSQVRHLISEPGAWDALRQGLEGGGLTRELRHECTWAIANLLKRNVSTLKPLDGQEVLRLITSALRVETDASLQRALLDAGEAVLRYSDGRAAMMGLGQSPLLSHAEKHGFIEKLEELQHSDSAVVYRKAIHMLESLFEATDRENEPPLRGRALPNENVRPATPSGVKGCQSPKCLSTTPSSIVGCAISPKCLRSPLSGVVGCPSPATRSPPYKSRGGA